MCTRAAAQRVASGTKWSATDDNRDMIRVQRINRNPRPFRASGFRGVATPLYVRYGLDQYMERTGGFVCYRTSLRQQSSTTPTLGASTFDEHIRSH